MTNEQEGTSVRETVSQIRFALSQLTSRNAQYEFEDLTRALARHTVARNILPATGPVGAGGDQGRDFETFRTYVAGEVLSVGRARGISDGDRIAFACTLQAKNVPGKVRSDVKKIAAGGDADVVVYYCEANLPIATRHELQDGARADYGLHLELFDGLGISELLAQRHLYWIAQEFLSLPAAALPGLERTEWYESDLGRWRNEARVPTTPGDLVDLSGCLRYAFRDEAQEDVRFWLDKLECLVRDGLPLTVQQSARYEIVVGHLRGLGDMRPADALVGEYFSNAASSDDPAQLADAANLLMYCVGARERLLTNHDEERLKEWNKTLQGRILDLLEETGFPGRRAALLETLGWLRAQPDLAAAKAMGIALEFEPESHRISLDEVYERMESGLVDPIDLPVIDLVGAFTAWLEMVEVMRDAPLFPVEHIAMLFRLSGHILSKDDRYDSVVTAVDERIAEVNGQAAAADNARARAMMFYEQGRLLAALRELHRVRLGWFSGEMSREFILAMLMMAQVYRELELSQAAKYCALAAVRLVQESERELLSRSLFKAAEADYHQGAWLSALLMNECGLHTHLLLEEDPQNLERHSQIQTVAFELIVIRAMAEAAGAPYENVVNESITSSGFHHLMDDFLSSLDRPPWWEGVDPDRLHLKALEQLGHPAFADGGERRSIAWSALGVHWTVECTNDYDSVLIAERVAAMAQMLLAELALEDPCLLPTRVCFEVEPLPKDAELSVKVNSDGFVTTCRAQIPELDGSSSESHKKAMESAVTAVMAVVAEISVLPQSEIAELFTRRAQGGLLDNLSLGVAYDAALAGVMTRDQFNESNRVACAPLPSGSSAAPKQHADLAADGDGPTYSRDKALDLAQSRYVNTREALVATLPELQKHEPFGPVVATLRDSGWKDWHILLAVYHVVQNSRFRFTAPRNEAELKEMFKKFTSPEEPGEPAPLELFTEDSLREAIKPSFASTLKVWELECNQTGVDIDAVEAFLATRYHYWEDDPPHEDPFLP